MSDQISKWNLSFPSSEDEDSYRKITLSHLKVEDDEVSQTKFLDNSPPTLLTLGIPGMENHELKIDSQQSEQDKKTRSIPCHENLDRKSRGRKRKCGENIEHLVPEFDANESGRTSRRIEDGLQPSKASFVKMHKMSEKRRRQRIAKRVKVLEELIPNCNKSSRASVLDQAIQYIQALQHQVQVMSMDGFPASNILARNQMMQSNNNNNIPSVIPQIMQNTLRFHPHVPIMRRVAVGSFFGLGTSMMSPHFAASYWSLSHAVIVNLPPLMPAMELLLQQNDFYSSLPYYRSFFPCDISRQDSDMEQSSSINLF
ncbi:PREDICTED: transcription factor PIL1-like [Nicotiana attenuata]|uniref:Transcription factor pif3 n=1 Tax=Nicotiana attenuata TaxID=49451 RepID=A0A1J6IRR5_NICAT|nr:PREDICTED: transcription factor PIL1-like [Nicotiana attenuata]OIT06924.1 transcription factor pif3 [Nicotiana attenuata]